MIERPDFYDRGAAVLEHVHKGLIQPVGLASLILFIADGADFPGAPAWYWGFAPVPAYLVFVWLSYAVLLGCFYVQHRWLRWRK